MLKKSLVSIVIGMATFVLVLTLTLNLTAALLTLVLISAIIIFQDSFSRGWLFLFAILTLIPATKIGGGSVTIYEILLAILALVGLVHIASGEVKVKSIKIYFLFFLLVLIGISVTIFGRIFHIEIDRGIFLLTALSFLTLATMVSFQHFFQTKKRIRRFLILLVSVGFAHALFGIFSLVLGWQSPTGMGITTGTVNFFSDSLIQNQINGFLGNGYILKVGENALAPFLLVSIPISISFLFSMKNSRKKKAVSLPTFQLFDSIHSEKQKKYWMGLLENPNQRTLLERTKLFFTPKKMLLAVLLVQIVGLILTFSYISLVVCCIGLFTIGVLLRKKYVVSIAIASLVIFTMVIPLFFSSITAESERNISTWTNGFEQIKSSWFWGNGWKIQKTESGSNEDIHNSFLLIWHNFGLMGFFVLIAMLVEYFAQLRRSYLTSDGISRNWLVAIIAIFVEFVFLATTTNSLFFGPAALVFWLLYAVGFNLRKKKVVFGLTETRLHF